MITSQQLDRIAQRLVADAGKGRVTTCALKEQAPTIARQIVSDAGSPLLSMWGISSNFDENARATITDAKIVTAIGSLAGVKMRSGKGCHAGLLHTYGYLFSRLQTPYGYKRDRWLQPTIENGLQLPPYTVRAEPGEGTLLQNLTYFLERIVFRDTPSKRKSVIAAEGDIADSLRDYRYDRLKIARITERVNVPATDGKSRRVTLLTDLVQFFARRKSQRTFRSLLVYATGDPEQGGVRLLTCFTVSAKTVSVLSADDNFGRSKPIRLRYNAVVEGFPAVGLLGSRRIAHS